MYSADQLFDGFRIDRIGVALSGGVDSSVTAALLQQSGYDVIGITFNISSFSDNVKRAAQVANYLGIQHKIFDLDEEFRKIIIMPFYEEYRLGRTPNPCIQCNKKIKLGLLMEKIHHSNLGVDAIATGHYASVEKDYNSGRYAIASPRDDSKDQSYFLFALDQFQLSHLLLPLSDYTKEEVRSIAKDFELPVFDQPESQEICFIPDNNYARFIEEHMEENIMQPGLIQDIQGKVIGEHKGIYRYTVGQRKGLGIASERPLFVLKIDPGSNSLIVGPREELRQKKLIVAEANYMKVSKLEGKKVWTRIRSTHKPAPGRAFSKDNKEILIKFDEFQEAIAPGQAAVIYDNDGCILAGGWIK